MKTNAIFYGAVLLLAPCCAYGQDTEAQTEEFFLNLAKDSLQLVWINPVEGNTEVNSKEIILKVGIKSETDITAAKISLNGLPLDSEERGFRRSDANFTYILEQSLTLFEGGNVIKLQVENEDGEKVTSERTIIVSVAGIVAGLERRDFALLFATDSYDEWGNLVNPVNDAKTIASELSEYYSFQVEMVENPSRDEIMVKIKEYAQKSYMDYDQLFIFFAGHGQFDEVFGEGFIVCRDSRLDDEARSSYIPHSVLRNAIDNIPSKHTLLVMDVCFGGTFDPLIARSGTRGGGDMYSEISTVEFIKRKLRFKTRQYITSGGKQYVPDGRPGMHSPFASKFLEGLRSYGGRDEVITLPELFNWLEKLSPEPRAGAFGTNEPGSDFIFVAHSPEPVPTENDE